MSKFPRARPGATARRWAADTAVAVAVAALGILLTAYGWGQHQATPLGLGLVAAGGLSLAARRAFPVTVLAIAYGTTFAYEVTQVHDGAIWFASIVAFCTAVYLGRRAAALGFLVACYLTYLCAPVVAGRAAPSAISAVSVGAGLTVLVGVAELLRLRGQRSTALAQRREEEIARRASEERLRMARDLHDVVAHNISVINVQSSTALHLMDRQPERARAALSVINDVSKQALVELRSALGILRDVDGGAPRAPSSSLAHLDDLLGRARASGLDVRLERAGGTEPLPAGVDLAAYRILQEALTNTARHSAGSGAVVRIRRAGPNLVLEVEDDGLGPAARNGSGNARQGSGNARQGSGNARQGSGNGIIGMTERAHALGGTLEAAPRPGGGFRVRARLPLASGPLTEEVR